MEGNCSTCRFSEAARVDRETKEVIWYRCRRYAPHPRLYTSQEMEREKEGFYVDDSWVVSPRVGESDWCGEHQSKAEEEI